jgi:hypothetical protein
MVSPLAMLSSDDADLIATILDAGFPLPLCPLFSQNPVYFPVTGWPRFSGAFRLPPLSFSPSFLTPVRSLDPRPNY